MTAGRWFLALCMVFTVGCQSTRPGSQSVLDNATFMDLWKVYRHCQSLTDLDLMKADSTVLSSARNHSEPGPHFLLPLPDKLERLVSRPSVRLAVDVNAMAAACTLRTGQLAFEAEQLDLANEMFHAVVDNYPHPDYSYYTVQARTALHEIENGLQVTLTLP